MFLVHFQGSVYRSTCIWLIYSGFSLDLFCLIYSGFSLDLILVNLFWIQFRPVFGSFILDSVWTCSTICILLFIVVHVGICSSKIAEFDWCIT